MTSYLHYSTLDKDTTCEKQKSDQIKQRKKDDCY